MKYLVFLTALIMLMSSGCMKHDQGCAAVDPKTEEPQIIGYATANSINTSKDYSGVYYEIINAGSGSTPMANSTVTVAYTGKLLNGYMFDQRTSYTNSLSGLMEGWQIGLPMIKKGGRIKLIIPSSLAFGCTGAANVPSNSVLYFDITLIDVK
jgi:FKBP-type peptidyl-prolyl cis-trans isomerase FkpA